MEPWQGLQGTQMVQHPEASALDHKDVLLLSTGQWGPNGTGTRCRHLGRERLQTPQGLAHSLA